MTDPATEPKEQDEAPSRRVTAIRRTRTVFWIAVAVGVAFAIFVAILATRKGAATREVDSPLLSKPAPDMAGTSIDGQSVRLSDYRGRWVLVNFFATWCIPCAEEHPDLVNFSNAHKTVGDAQVLGVIYADTAQDVRGYRSSKGGDWPMITDPNGQIALDFGVQGIPESYLVNPEGIVVSKIVGGIQDPQLENLLQRAERGPTG